MAIDYNPMQPKVIFPPLAYEKQQANATQKEHDEALRDAKRYRAIKRLKLQHIDSADDYGYAAEEIDKECDEQIEWFRKYDANELK